MLVGLLEDPFKPESSRQCLWTEEAPLIPEGDIHGIFIDDTKVSRIDKDANSQEKYREPTVSLW